MSCSNPFNVDASQLSNEEVHLLGARGSYAIREFCGFDVDHKHWERRGPCVLKARRGFGKTHLLMVRGLKHRQSTAAAATLFYPEGGSDVKPIDPLNQLHVSIPRWLDRANAQEAWTMVWQLSILGLLVWVSGARKDSLRGFSDWFGGLMSLENMVAGKLKGEVSSFTVLHQVMTRVLEQLQGDDYHAGKAKLVEGLFYAAGDWTIAIKAQLHVRTKSKIAIYLDSPDELVYMDRTNLWRNIQQGLLLAIWKFSKDTQWSSTLLLYACVRSEAFGSGHDHEDIALANGLILGITYTEDQLKEMIDDRIQQATPERLTLSLSDVDDPLHALCGFSKVVHDDRGAIGGGRFVESVFSSILRHTMQVPRELIAICAEIYNIRATRTAESVRKTVNSRAAQNVQFAINKSFLGWNDAQHRSFSAELNSEVIDAATMRHITSKFGTEGSSIVKFFIQHGLLGIAEPHPKRHRHFYYQRFSYDDLHGQADSSSINKDYFFVHPAFKEWLLTDPSRLGIPFKRYEYGVIGELQAYESMPPAISLSMSGELLELKLRDHENFSVSRTARSEPLRAFYVLLWTCKARRTNSVNYTEFMAYHAHLRNIPQLKDQIRITTSRDPHRTSEHIRKLSMTFNADKQMRLIHKGFLGENRYNMLYNKTNVKMKYPFTFFSVSIKSSTGVEPQFTINDIDIDDVDWDRCFDDVPKSPAIRASAM